MPITPISDVGDDIKRRIMEVNRKVTWLEKNPAIVDDKELKEREEAARAYAGESERHFVDYAMDCVKQSIKASKDIRKIQALCYGAYKENEPVYYAKKEEWQSRIVIPKPFETVQYGAAAVRKAFTPRFLSIENFTSPEIGTFWKKMMELQLNEQHAKFVLRFTDAVTMALAIGITMEIIPRWTPGLGLEYVLIEPWKIHRDPDAASRDCQSGIYWIHQEWLDYYVLKAGEKSGKYRDVDRAKETSSENATDEFMTKEAIAQRKEQIWTRSDFRTMILASEFWGTVLSPRGELLLDRATYTVAGGRVIEYPRAVNYARLRWPGIAFSPIPDLLKMGGRGLLEGVLSIWEAMNNIMCLHVDNLQWLVNPMTEINVEALVDPEDSKGHPGKEYLVQETVSGAQAVRSVNRRSVTGDVLANVRQMDQMFQSGSFVPNSVKGAQGPRKEITYRESAMLLDQALAVYSLIGENVEQGAIETIMAGAELIKEHATIADYQAMFQPEELEELGIHADQDSANGCAGVPKIDGSFHVSGIQALMRSNECLANLKQVIIPLVQKQGPFTPYLKPYNILKSFATRTNLTDEDIMATDDEAKAIDAIIADAQKKQAEQAEQQGELAEAHAAMDMADRLDDDGTERPEATEGRQP